MREDEGPLNDHHHESDQQQSSSAQAVPTECAVIGQPSADATEPSHVQPASPPRQQKRQRRRRRQQQQQPNHGHLQQGQAASPSDDVARADSESGIRHASPCAVSSSTSSSNLAQETAKGPRQQQHEAGTAVLEKVQHRRKRQKASEHAPAPGHTEVVQLPEPYSSAQQDCTGGTAEHRAAEHMLQQPVDQQGLGAMPQLMKLEDQRKESDREQLQQQQQQLAADDSEQIQMRQRQQERKQPLVLRNPHQRAQPRPLPQLQQTLGRILAKILPQPGSASSGGSAANSGGQLSIRAEAAGATADTTSPVEAIKVAASIMSAAGQQPNLSHIAAVAARLLSRQQQVQEVVKASTGPSAGAADLRRHPLQQSYRGGASATASVKVFRRNLPSAAPLTFAAASDKTPPPGTAAEQGSSGTGASHPEQEVAGAALTSAPAVAAAAAAAAATTAAAAGSAAVAGHSVPAKRSLSGGAAGTGSKPAPAAVPSRSTTLIHRKHRTLCQVYGCGIDLTAKKGTTMWKYRCCARHMLEPAVTLNPEKPLELSRFCNQCCRFEPLANFDGAKRSCRLSLMARFDEEQRGGPTTTRGHEHAARAAAAAATGSAADQARQSTEMSHLAEYAAAGAEQLPHQGAALPLLARPAAAASSPGTAVAQEGNDESEQPEDLLADAVPAIRLSTDFHISRAPTNEEIEQIMRETLLQELDLAGDFDPTASLRDSGRAALEQQGIASPAFHSSQLAALHPPGEVALIQGSTHVAGTGTLEQLQLGMNPTDLALPDDLEAADDLLRDLMAAYSSGQQGWQGLGAEPMVRQLTVGEGVPPSALGNSSNLQVHLPAVPPDTTTAAAAAAGTLLGPMSSLLPVAGQVPWLAEGTASLPAASSEILPGQSLGMVLSTHHGAGMIPSAAAPGPLIPVQSVTDTTPGLLHAAAAADRNPRQSTQLAVGQGHSSLDWYNLQSPLIPGVQDMSVAVRDELAASSGTGQRRGTSALQQPTIGVAADALQPAAAAAAGLTLPGMYSSPFASLSADAGTAAGDGAFAAAAVCPIDSLPASPVAAADEQLQHTTGRQQEMAGQHHSTSTAAPAAAQMMAPPLQMAARQLQQQQQQQRYHHHLMQVMQPSQQQPVAGPPGPPSGHSPSLEHQLPPLHDSSLSSLTRQQLPLLLQASGSHFSVAGRGEIPTGRPGSWSATGVHPSQSLGRAPSFASGPRHLADALTMPVPTAGAMPRQDSQNLGYPAEAAAHAAAVPQHLTTRGQIPVAAAAGFAAVDHQAANIRSVAAAGGPATALEGSSIDANALEQRLRHMQQEALHMQQMIQMLRAQHEAGGQRLPQQDQQEPAAPSEPDRH